MEHILIAPEDIDSVLQLALAHASPSPTTFTVQPASSGVGHQMETHIPSYSQAETLMSTQEANERIQVRQLAQGNLQELQQNATHDFMSPSPSQAETLMSTQDAKERVETRAAAKGKGREEQATTPSTSAKQQASMGPPVKPTFFQAYAAPPQSTDQPQTAPANSSAPTTPANATASNTVNTPQPTAAAPNTPTPKSVLPLKRGPGRPRKSDPVGPPPSKRPRGRPRNTTTPLATRRRISDDIPSEGDSVPAPVDNSDDSDYHDSDEESSSTLPPNILAQYTAHVAILRTRLDSRGIPEQYSLFKSFWVPPRSSYFDGGATAPPGRFVYWDPLFITSVSCPVCQQPLAIAAGGGWLDAPLSLRDEEGPCWIIGRRYVCTQCFGATEEAARYVSDGLDTDTGGSNAPSSGTSASADTKPKSKPDFSSTVYYLSWEKRFRALLPDALASEFPTRVRKRAASDRTARENTAPKDGDAEVDAEESVDAPIETPRRTRRTRHCMKCGSKSCPGRLTRSRCPNGCYDCGLVSCRGRTSGIANVTCKGEPGASFKELSRDGSTPPATSPDSSSTTPAPPQSLTWPANLPQVPSGYVLAIPYAVGTDGKPAGAGPGMAYLVPQGEIPGFAGLTGVNGVGANSNVDTNGTTTSASESAAPAPTSAPAAASGSTSTSTPAPAPSTTSEAQAQPLVQEKAPHPKPTAPAKPVSKAKVPAQPQPQPQPQPQAQAPAPVPAHAPVPIAPAPAVSHPQPHPHPQPHLHPQVHPPPHPQAHPLPHPPHHGAPYHPPHPGAPYPPPPPHGGAPDPAAYYGGYYPAYGYPPPYGYGYYPHYPPPPGVNPNHTPGPNSTEPGAGPPGMPGYPQYAVSPYPGQPGYGVPPPPPPQSTGYPPPNSGYTIQPPPAPAPVNAPATANGYIAAPAGQQPIQYRPYQVPDASRPATATGTGKKRKAAATGDEAAKKAAAGDKTA
ncbi:hypothetical protein BDV93DRAFT_609368 [Ceratobasidium sp. AG-I]|nr:hypothetical protein BDV93DRAFT_609368 [Ceratobasidium sp. AG-I]